MKGRIISGLLIASAILFAASSVLAAPWGKWRGSGGWGMNSSYQRMYNPATVETVTGTVQVVSRIIPIRGMRAGIHLTVRTDKEDIDVHLGPEWYIERQDTKIEQGDKVAIKGSRVVIDNKTVLIAAEVRKGESTLVLRDETGAPAWAGWRR
ncbi:MAG: hypothetical protein M0024_03750 [Nitrospiraceae bacterium]|nr:hypothetical protein [Nitrospiraceae bacterium]